VYLAFAFCFASTYIIVAFLPWSWFFVQAVTVFFLFLAICEWHGKKRYWLIGLYYAVILASRFTAALTIVFFIGDILWDRKLSGRGRSARLGLLLAPAAAAGLLLAWYNYSRFGDPFDSGYMRSGNVSDYIYFRYEQLNYGLFQLRNIPTNFYYYFIKTLDPVLENFYNGDTQTYILKYPYITVTNPGTSFFVSSPIFLFVFYALRRRIRTRVVWLSLAAVCAVLPILLTFFWPGMKQVGPRYMLDFLPFLYLILLQSFEKYRLPFGAKVLIVVSAFIDFLLFIAVTFYP
jgi:hypothetical protein